jgi:copper chaperone
METVRLTIEGMTCSHCQAAVETALRGKTGVQSATVYLQDGSAEVEYDPARVSPGQLAEVVEEEGYAATVA